MDDPLLYFKNCFFVLVVHFFIVHNDGSTQDISSDPDLSPNVENFYPNNFITNGLGLILHYKSIGYTLINNGKYLIANGDTSTNVIQWKFGSPENYDYDGTKNANCVHRSGASAASSNGILISYVMSHFKNQFLNSESANLFTFFLFLLFSMLKKVLIEIIGKKCHYYCFLTPKSQFAALKKQQISRKINGRFKYDSGTTGVPF